MSRFSRRPRRVGLFFVLAFVAAVAAALLFHATRIERSICYSCLWRTQPPRLESELIEMYSAFPCADDFCRAETSYIVGNLLEDDERMRASIKFYESASNKERSLSRALIIEMALGMAGGRGGVDEKPHLARASALASAAGRTATSRLLAAMRDGEATPRFGTAPIQRRLVVPAAAQWMVLGESTIRIEPGARVGLQLERTYRDWLSYQLYYDFREKSTSRDKVLPYHEGARLRDILASTAVTPIPLVGTVLATRGEDWYAPDEEGVFRFKVLRDKVWYPTTKRRGDFALMTDTHGISSIVEQAIRAQVDLVIGCGDSEGKAEAAFYLARRGIDVYMPCDRFIAQLLGYDAPGMILGTAPVKVESGQTIIGHQPVRFRRGEKIVVSDVRDESASQYNDAPARYFRELVKMFPLDVHTLVVGSAPAAEVTAEANRTRATAVSLRIANEQDYAVMKQWLAASPERRAVLFHSAPYPPGHRLFADFPQQVTFGDPRPRFLL